MSRRILKTNKSVRYVSEDNRSQNEHVNESETVIDKFTTSPKSFQQNKRPLEKY